ncbi:hypothetical protein GCM10022214_42880 [Actinomadura miaoliensis]|uniref:Uncharacterized protein n=1 Tax=Actinomadura miaoliensis TaxID=430685 RepID=A0ABP7W2T0_9ACTN
MRQRQDGQPVPGMRLAGQSGPDQQHVADGPGVPEHRRAAVPVRDAQLVTQQGRPADRHVDPAVQPPGPFTVTSQHQLLVQAQRRVLGQRDLRHGPVVASGGGHRGLRREVQVGARPGPRPHRQP